MEQNPQQRRISEISHLFLSDVRAKQTGNAPRPIRKPPGAFRQEVSIDITPEEFAHVFDKDDTEISEQPGVFIANKPVRAVIAHHIGEQMGDQVRYLAGMLCHDGSRIGLIYADAAEVRICCIEHNPHQGPIATDCNSTPIEPMRIEQAIIELNQDVDEWMIVLPDTHCGESRSILKSISNWILLSGVEHDSVVDSYRTLKGLCDSHKPHVSIAIVGSSDEDELRKTYQKLSSVCSQFMQLETESFGAIEPNHQLAEHVVLEASATHNKAHMSSPSHWPIIKKLVATKSEPTTKPQPVATAPQVASKPAAPVMGIAKERYVRAEVPEITEQAAAQPKVAMPANISSEEPVDQIFDLADTSGSPAALVRAVIQGTNDLVETPIKASQNPDAVITVSRDHRLVMVAVARNGLADLRSIAQAYRWMSDNRTLIGMAIPQFSLDAHALPRLELLVNHADMTADVLQPLLSSGYVTVRAYRKLRWGEKTGLLLEAA